MLLEYLQKKILFQLQDVRRVTLMWSLPEDLLSLCYRYTRVKLDLHTKFRKLNVTVNETNFR